MRDAHEIRSGFVRFSHLAIALAFALAVGSAYSAFDFTTAAPRVFNRESAFIVHRLAGILGSLVAVAFLFARARPIIDSARGDTWRLMIALWHLLLLVLIIATGALAWLARASLGEMFSITPKFNLVSKADEAHVHIMFYWHKTLASCLIAMVALHVLAALVHAVALRDGTLSSMILGRHRQ